MMGAHGALPAPARPRAAGSSQEARHARSFTDSVQIACARARRVDRARRVLEGIGAHGHRALGRLGSGGLRRDGAAAGAGGRGAAGRGPGGGRQHALRRRAGRGECAGLFDRAHVFGAAQPAGLRQRVHRPQRAGVCRRSQLRQRRPAAGGERLRRPAAGAAGAGGRRLGAPADAGGRGVAAAVSRRGVDGRLLGLARPLGVERGPLVASAASRLPVARAVLRAPRRQGGVRAGVLVGARP